MTKVIILHVDGNACAEAKKRKREGGGKSETTRGVARFCDAICWGVMTSLRPVLGVSVTERASDGHSPTIAVTVRHNPVTVYWMPRVPRWPLTRRIAPRIGSRGGGSPAHPRTGDVKFWGNVGRQVELWERGPCARCLRNEATREVCAPFHPASPFMGMKRKLISIMRKNPLPIRQ